MSVSESYSELREHRNIQDPSKGPPPKKSYTKIICIATILALALGIGLLIYGVNLQGPGQSGIPNWAIDQLMASLNGTVVMMGDQNYNDSVKLWNPIYDMNMPYMIIYCGNSTDIETAADFAILWSLNMSLRSGGHSFMGWSSNTGGVIIDVSMLNEVTIDQSAMEVTVWAGATLYDVFAATAPLNWMLPISPSPTVGIAGFTLGGGSNNLARMYGLAIDSVVGFEMLSNTGNIPDNVLTWNYVVNSTYPQLYWALLGGGGGNFGAVFSITFKAYNATTAIGGYWVYPLNQSDALASLYDQTVYGRNDTAEWYFLLEWVEELGQSYVVLSGTWIGNIQKGMAALAPFLALNPIYNISMSGTYAQVMEFMFMNNNVTAESFTAQSGFLMQQGAVVLSGGFSSALAMAITAATTPYAGVSVGAWVEPFGAGYAVNQVPSSATAFVSRSSAGIFGLWVSWDNTTTQAMAQMVSNSVYNSITSYLISSVTNPNTKLAYINYPWNMTNYGAAYWDTNLQMLQTIKFNWDPANVFMYSQSVPLSATS